MNSQAENSQGEVVLYRSSDGDIHLDVQLENESVWLSLSQMTKLFGRDKSVIFKHLKNIYTSKELIRKATIAKKAMVQKEGKRQVVREVEFFNLDAILSVGYRVNSKRGTQFRIWATRTLKDHLLRGYTLNERRLREKGVQIEQAVALLGKTLTNHALVTDEGRAVLDVVQGYTKTWRLLLAYDENRLPEVPEQAARPGIGLSLAEARLAIRQLRNSLALRNQATKFFGNEHTDQLPGILGSIEQTFDGEPLYPTLQARAAHLLYFIIKDHPFSDGNKRIGTLLFLEYLRRNGLLWKPDGSPRLAANTMVALALLVAESNQSQKELMVRLTLNLLDDDKQC